MAYTYMRIDKMDHPCLDYGLLPIQHQTIT